MRNLLVVTALVAAFSQTTLAGSNPTHKIAVHVMPHGATCKGLPSFETCSDIQTTYPGLGDIDVVPVFFDLVEFTVVEFGLTWPTEWGTMAYTRCAGDMAVGEIVEPGGGTATVWTTCQQAWSVAHGHGWLTASVPGTVTAVANPATGDYGTVDCDLGGLDPYDPPLVVLAARVGGGLGDDPCGQYWAPLKLSVTDGLGGRCAYQADSILYEISYDNLINVRDVHNVVLTDTLPAGTDFISASPGGSYSVADHTVTWAIGTIPAEDEGGTKHVLVGVIAPPGGTLDNACSITSTEAGLTDAALTTQVCRVDSLPLEIDITDGLNGSCIMPRSWLTYSIQYSNFDNITDIHNVILTDCLSAATFFQSATAGGVYDKTSRTVTWSLGTLAPGASGSVEVVAGAQCDFGARIVNTCRIVGEETPPAEDEQWTDFCVQAPLPPSLSKSDGWPSSCSTCCRYPGDLVTYRINYESQYGSTELHNLVLRDYLPAELEFVSATAGGTYDPGDHTVVWLIGDLPERGAGWRDLTTRVIGPRGGAFTNVCEIASDETSPVTATDGSPICSDPLSPLNLSKSRASNAGCISCGDTVTYRLAYDNNRNTVEAHNVLIKDTLPSALGFASASDGGNYDAGSHVVTWSIGTLGPGEGGLVTVAAVLVTAPPYYGEEISNMALIRCDGTRDTQAHMYSMVCIPKVSVYVLPHGSNRTCSAGMPQVSYCQDIIFATGGCDVDVFPVFFDLDGYRGFEYGMEWPASWSSMSFTSCSDATSGGIVHPGDGISQSWTTCRTGYAAVTGCGHLVADGPGQVRLIPHPLTARIGYVTCSGDTCALSGSFAAGVCGASGEPPPCSGMPHTRPTTWGAIKAMFK
jgi:uncharacterized repeat protein (TIGR01451 family)